MAKKSKKPTRVNLVKSKKPTKKRKNKAVTKNVFKCGICNEPIQVTDIVPNEFYFCAKCTRGPFGKLGMWFVDLFVVFKSFILGK